MKQNIITNGISMENVLAMILSYVEHNSIFGAIILGIFGWFYVVYFIIVYRIF